VPCLSAFGALYKFTFTFTFTIRAGVEEGGLKSYYLSTSDKNQPAPLSVASVRLVSPRTATEDVTLFFLK